MLKSHPPSRGLVIWFFASTICARFAFILGAVIAVWLHEEIAAVALAACVTFEAFIFRGARLPSIERIAEVAMRATANERDLGPQPQSKRRPADKTRIQSLNITKRAFGSEEKRENAA